ADWDSRVPFCTMRRPGRSVENRRPSGANARLQGTMSPVATVSTKKRTPSAVVKISVPGPGVGAGCAGEAGAVGVVPQFAVLVAAPPVSSAARMTSALPSLRCPGRGGCDMLEHLAALHHESHARDRGDVVERIAIEADEVRL